MTAEASAGDQWKSGLASGSASPSSGQAHARSWPLSFAADSSVPVDRPQHRMLALESSMCPLVESSSDHDDDPSGDPEMTTVMKGLFLCVSLPARRFSRKSHEVFPHSRLVRCNDHCRVLVTVAKIALNLCVASLTL